MSGRGHAGRSVHRSVLDSVVKVLSRSALAVAAFILLFSPSEVGERESDQ